jgi:hypothetical protein
MQTLEYNPFAQELDELINVYARNFRLWLTIGLQELFQVDEKMQKTLLTMGTQIFGSTSDMQTAIGLSENLYRAYPKAVKHYQPVYMGQPFESLMIVDVQPTFYTLDEQHYERANDIKDQGTFHFLVRIARREGDVRGGVYPLTIKNMDKGQWVNEALVSEARRILSRRCGVPVSVLLSDVEARNQLSLAPPISSTLPPVTPARRSRNVRTSENI